MPDTLYYDGKCPLCSHEIRLLKRFKGKSLTLIDIHSDDNQQTVLSTQTLLAVLHLQTSLTGFISNGQASEYVS